MEEGSKRRLVGTAVVVVLLVIFLPMLLEEEDANPVPDSDLQIPDQPAFGREFDPELPDSAAATFVPSPVQSQPQAEGYQTGAPGLEPEPAYQPEPSYQPEQPKLVAPAMQPSATSPARAEPKPQPKAEPAKPAPEAVAKKSPAPVAKPEQRSSEPKPSGPSWVIQVSSLTEKPRALSLEKELRAKGFPVFIEQAEVGGRLYHRVRIGPRGSKRDIKEMAASLRKKTGHEGQILRYAQ